MLVQEVIQILAKQSGLDLPYPTLSSQYNWLASCVVTCHLVEALWEWVGFFSDDHVLML